MLLYTMLQHFKSWPLGGLESRREGLWIASSQKPGNHPNFRKKRSRSEKAILGALGEFPVILGAALGIRNSILGIQNSILGTASHDLSNKRTKILGATPGAIPGIDGNP